MPNISSQIYSYFGDLLAESETTWLHRAFVPPDQFDLMTSERSILVFGPRGSGKSVLSQALIRYVKDPKKPLPILVIEWQAELLDMNQQPGEMVKATVNQILNLCGEALLEHVGHHPERYQSQPKWVQDTFDWFIHRYSYRDYSVLLGQLSEQIGKSGNVLLEDILGRTPRDVLRSNTPDSMIIRELATLTKRLGLSSIWVVADGLERWLDIAPEIITGQFKTVLSTLALFEVPGFVLKLIAPVEMKAMLGGTSGILRRRLDAFTLEWSEKYLVEIVRKRLALVYSQPDVQLTALGDPKQLLKWLNKYGSNSPKSWLSLCSPFVDALVERQLASPLTAEEFVAITQKHPPRLRIDFNEQVYLGYQPIDDISLVSYKLLRYLYDNNHTICSREKLYYHAQQGMEKLPEPDDPEYIPPANWKSSFETAIWRLRQEIEPNPKKPAYIITVRNRGVRIENIW